MTAPTGYRGAWATSDIRIVKKALDAAKKPKAQPPKPAKP